MGSTAAFAAWVRIVLEQGLCVSPIALDPRVDSLPSKNSADLNSLQLRTLVE
ncbi:hypothetical protein J6590_044242 [Homalodisca vitripennis]|nr:hypothetical protein J6590_044242 [Homalodisca vitripennis]